MGISRRDFLKVGLAGVAGFYLAPAFGRPMPPFNEVRKGMRGIPTFCTICPAHCGIKGILKGERLVAIEGNPDSPNNMGGICAKGIAAINQLYDPERLLYPMKRVGERGEGKWRRISWDEAFWELSSRLADILKNGHPEEIIFDLGFSEPLLLRFLNALGGAVYIDRAALAHINADEGHRLFWGKGRGVPDLAHSRYILNFGANPYETGDEYVGMITRLIKGRENGAKLITFDPRLSYTAGKSDEWHPIKPGTDAALALALAQSIVAQGLHDRTFLEKWTEVQEEQLRLLSPFTPEWAEGITGIKAADIKRIASEFSKTKPSTIIIGGGVSQRQKGALTTRTILLLNVLVGNINVKGGYLAPQQIKWEEPLPSPPERNKKANLSLYSALREGKRRTRLLFLYRSDPIHLNPGGIETKEILRDESKVSYLIAMDLHMTQSASLADLILPAAVPLECWGLTARVTPEGKGFISLRQPVVHPLGEPALLRPKEIITKRKREFPLRMAPLGEALALSELCIELAQRLGGKVKEFFPFQGTEEYLAQWLAKIPSLQHKGGLSYLKKKGIFILPRLSTIFRKMEFSTPTGKIRVPLAELLRAEPWRQVRTSSSFPYQLVIYGRGVSSGRISNAKWIAEIVHDNPLLIHPETAKNLKIKEGDRVQVRSRAGELDAEVKITEGIRPETVALAKDFTPQGCRITQGKKFKSSDPDTQLLWWGGEKETANPALLLPQEHDPLGGGMNLAGVEVEIKKIG